MSEENSSENKTLKGIVVDPYQQKLFCYDTQRHNALREKNLLDFFTDFWMEGLGELFMGNPNLRCCETISVSHPLLQYYVDAARNISFLDKDNKKKKKVKDLLQKVKNYDAYNLTAEAECEQFIQKVKSIQKFSENAGGDNEKIKIYWGIENNFGDLLSSSINISGSATDSLTLGKISSVLKIEISKCEQFAEADIIVLTKSPYGKPADEIRNANNNSKKIVFIANREEDKTEADDGYPTFWNAKEDHLKKLICYYIDLYYLRWRFLDLWKKCLQTATFRSIEEAQEFLSLGISSSAYIVEAPKSVSLGKTCVIKCDYITPFGTQTTNPQDESVFEIDSSFMSKTEFENEITVKSHEIKSHRIPIVTSKAVYSYENSRLKKLESPFLEIEVKDNGLAAGIKLEFTKSPSLLRPAEGTHAYSSFDDDKNSASIRVINYDCSSEKAYEVRCGKKISFKIILEPHNGGKHVWAEGLEYDICNDNNKNDINKKEVYPTSYQSNSYQVEYTPPENPGKLTIIAKTKESNRECQEVIYVLPDADEIDLDISGSTESDKIKIIEKVYEDKANYSIKGEEKKRVKKIRCFEGTKFHIQYCGVYRANTAQKVWNKECKCVFQNSSGEKWDSPSSFTLYAPGSYTLKTTLHDNSSVSYCFDIDVIVDQSQKAQKWLMATCGIGLLTTLCWYGLNLVTFALYCLCPLCAIAIWKKKKFYPALRKEWLLGLPILSVLFILKALYEELF